MATFTATASPNPQRLIDALDGQYPATGRRALLDLVRAGGVTVEGRKSGPRRFIESGEEIVLIATPPPLLHDDGTVLAADKPPGMPVHRAEGRDDDLTTMLVAWFEALGRHHGVQLAPAGRLDAETSGVVVFGLTPKAQRRLSGALGEGRADKRYVAVVAGQPPDEAVYEEPIEDRASRTELSTLARGPGYALVELHPTTGRRHQIRRHLAGAGHAVVGDRRYGDPAALAPRERGTAPRGMLHARALTMRHPTRDGDLTLEAPLPADFLACCEALGLKAGASSVGT